MVVGQKTGNVWVACYCRFFYQRCHWVLGGIKIPTYSSHISEAFRLGKPVKNMETTTLIDSNSTDTDVANLNSSAPEQPLKNEVTKEMLKAAQLFAGTNDIRYYLNGVFLDSKTGNMVATDGHRLIVIEAGLKSEHDVIIPIDLLDNVIKALGKTETVEIEYDPETKVITFRSRLSTWSAKAIEGRYPDYQAVIPGDEVRSPGVFNPDYLTDAAKAAGLLVGSRNKMFGLVLKTNAPDNLDDMSYNEAVALLGSQRAVFKGEDFSIVIFPQRV